MATDQQTCPAASQRWNISLLRHVSIYEAIALAICSVSFAAVSGNSLVSASILSTATTAIAIAWNYLYTSIFEAWEARQSIRGRDIKRRIVHAVGLETGLLTILVPLIASWLNKGLLRALMMNLGLAAFFLCYTMGYNCVFDKVFGLPASARA